MRFLQGAAEAAFRCYNRVRRLLSRYAETHQRVGMLKDEAVASDSATRKIGLGITHLGSALPLRSGKRNVPLFIKAVAVYTKDDTKDKRAEALFRPFVFYSYDAALLEKFEVVHKKVFIASESTSEKFL